LYHFSNLSGSISILNFYLMIECLCGITNTMIL